MKKLIYLIIGILSTILLFSQCNKPPFFYADPFEVVDFYFVNNTEEKCYIEIILKDYLCKKNLYNSYFDSNLEIPYLLTYTINPDSCKLIFTDSQGIMADYQKPNELGMLIVKNESGDIIYAQSPIRDDLWDYEDKSKGLMRETDWYFHFSGQTGDKINPFYCQCDLNDTCNIEKHIVSYKIDNRFINDSLLVEIEFNKKDNGHYCVESYPDTILINIPPNQYEVEIFKDSIPKCQNIEKPSNIFKSLIVTTSTGDTIFKQEEYNNCLWCVYNLTHQKSYELFLDR